VPHEDRERERPCIAADVDLYHGLFRAEIVGGRAGRRVFRSVDGRDAVLVEDGRFGEEVDLDVRDERGDIEIPAVVYALLKLAVRDLLGERALRGWSSGSGVSGVWVAVGAVVCLRLAEAASSEPLELQATVMEATLPAAK
jgi:hypothetical protein